MAYVDGFVLPVKRALIADYEALARAAGEIWMDHGAIGFTETVADDVPEGKVTSFPMAVKLEADEVVVFSFIVFRSREERDAINAKVMADPRMPQDMKVMPFDMERMIYGGFRGLVEMSAA